MTHQHHPVRVRAPLPGVDLHESKCAGDIVGLLQAVKLGQHAVVDGDKNKSARQPVRQLVVDHAAGVFVAQSPGATVHHQDQGPTAGRRLAAINVQGLRRGRPVGDIAQGHHAGGQGGRLTPALGPARGYRGDEAKTQQDQQEPSQACAHRHHS